MIEKYEKYLSFIQEYLRKFFEQQKPYVFCKEGCSICCEIGHYPMSELEFNYLSIGFSLLESEKKKRVQNNIKKYKRIIQNPSDYYMCPFLLDNRCSVYNYRPLICRSYGLLYFVTNDKGVPEFKIPCCVSHGLNYSNVYDENKKSMSKEKFIKLGIKEEPLSYNVSLEYLQYNEFTSGLDFGKSKKMIDWFD